MPKNNEINYRRILYLILIIDASASMNERGKMECANIAVSELVEELKSNKDNYDADIRIFPIAVSSEQEPFLFSEPIILDDYTYSDLKASGRTPFAPAFETLARQLSKDKWFSSDMETSFYHPNIILWSDGYSTDSTERLAEALNTLHSNKYFEQASKVAIGIGNKYDRNMLESFTGSSDTVIEVSDKQQLLESIKFIAMTTAFLKSNTLISDAAEEAVRKANLKNNQTNDPLDYRDGYDTAYDQHDLR